MKRLLPALFSAALLFSASNAFGQQQKTPTHDAPTQKAPIRQVPITRAPTPAEREVWRKAILKTARPKSTGCFTASYPDKAWREAPCKTPPHKLYMPKRPGMLRIETVGGAGPDFSAVVTGHITEAEGSFDSVTSVTSECAVQCPSQVCPANPTCPGGTSNQYSLQLNSKPFTTSACSGSPSPSGCQGWEQFVYSSSGGAFIQYWLENYGPSGTLCPPPRGGSCVQGEASSDGWCPFSFSTGGAVYCVVNAQSSAPAPSEAITSLGQLQLTGTAAGGGSTNDSITVSVGSSTYSASGNNYFPDLGSQWQEVEFNIFGDGGGDQAVFNSGATLHPRTSVSSGTTNGPSCDLQSFTGESNNLTLANTPPAAVSGAFPALLFSSSDPAPFGGSATCADATSVGDTHLTTFKGLYYDFQASGDFVLAQNGSDFQVQTRQASGAPTWPNASVNKAVAIQMGKTRVALYIEPTRLIIDGATNNLADGRSILLPSGVQVTHQGNLYIISSENGDRVRAVLNSTWMNVSVGLGRAPLAEPRGLLGNPAGNARALATSRGAVLIEPVSFNDLYHTYADSWRVQPAESLFNQQTTIRPGIPERTFVAKDLDPQVSAKSLAACKAAGITAPDLLEACTLDHAVLHDNAALKVFLHAPVPLHVLRPTSLDVKAAIK